MGPGIAISRRWIVDQLGPIGAAETSVDRMVGFLSQTAQSLKVTKKRCMF